MKINLKIKNSDNLEIKKIIIWIIFFTIIFMILVNGYLKTNKFYNLKTEYKKLIEISNENDNYQYKYNKKLEEINEFDNKKLNWGVIFNTLYSRVPDNVLITKIEYNNYKFSITGTAKEKKEIFVFTKELKKINFCSEVFVDDLQNNSKIIYKIKFLLNN